MLVYPPLPPKDYVIRDISKNQLSGPEFTPNALEPRITLRTIGKHCFPVEATDFDPAPQVPFKEVNKDVVKTWIAKGRDHWVSKPGKEDYYLHEIYKKYNVVVSDNNDPRYQHRVPVFCRSFKFELDCHEKERLKKLYAKIDRNEDEDKERQYKQIYSHDKGKLQVGYQKPPRRNYFVTYPRWQYEPALFAPSQTDPCKRRSDFERFGQGYKTEACRWYYENYPPPKINWRPFRFA